VKIIAIAGGIGAGKSAATDYLADRGFAVIDADDVAHAVTQPGEPAWAAMRDAFGDAVLGPDQTSTAPSSLTLFSMIRVR